jgi:hypothetical protein
VLRPDQWLVVDERGHQLPPERFPSHRALATGRQIESTVLGLYHRTRQQLMWLSVTAMPQFPPGGDRPDQVLTLFGDVTTLKRDSTLFDRAQAMAHIGGWEWDVAPDRLYLTEEAQRILGRRPTPSRACSRACAANTASACAPRWARRFRSDAISIWKYKDTAPTAAPSGCA